MGEVLVKCIYFLINFTGFWFTNRLLNNRFTNYGVEWIRWSQLNNTVAYRFTHPSNQGSLAPKPGDYLLPSLGFCDVAEGYHDNIVALNNKYRTICEVSQHVVYQYIFLVLWFVLLVGILISLASFSQKMFSLLLVNACALLSTGNGKHNMKRDMVCLLPDNEDLTLREMQYMELIRRKNHIMHSEVLYLLRQEKTI